MPPPSAAGYMTIGSTATAPQTSMRGAVTYSPLTAAAVAAAAAANYTQQLQKKHEHQPASSNPDDKDGPEQKEMKYNLIVNYLPQTMTQEEFKALFMAMGEIESCRLIKDKTNGQSLGYGFVNYVALEDAEKAISSLNGLRLQNKLIKVSFARPSSEMIKGANLYISGLPKTVTQQELEQMFASFGNIITTRLLTEQDGTPKGVGFVRFDKKEQAEEAIAQLDQSVPIGGTDPITVKFANTPANAGPKHLVQSIQSDAIMPITVLNAASRRYPAGPIHATTASAGRFRYSPMGTDILTSSVVSAGATMNKVPGGTGYSIFVYNLAAETEDSILWQLFGPFGAVLQVKVIREPTGKCKGYGFVTMAIYEEACSAIQHLHGTTLAGRVLQISFKSPSTRKM